MMSEIDESYDLYRLDLDGTNEVLISDHAGIVQLFEDKLCYRNEDGLWAYSVVSGETERLRDDPGRPYFISDGMIYYNSTSGETTQRKDSSMLLCRRIAFISPPNTWQ